MVIYFFIGLFAVMVLFLSVVGIVQLKLSRDLALRMAYIEGTTDLIFQSQEHINKVMVAFMENE